MKVTKSVLFAVLHARHKDDQPSLAQQLPQEFDTDAYPGLLDGLGLTEADLTGAKVQEAERLSELDGDPHGQFRDSWPVTETRAEHARLIDDLADEASAPDTSAGGEPNGRR